MAKFNGGSRGGVPTDRNFHAVLCGHFGKILY